MHAWVRLKPHTHTKCGLSFPPQYHISYTWGSLHSPIICKCLLKVLCPVSRQLTTLVCFLLSNGRYREKHSRHLIFLTLWGVFEIVKRNSHRKSNKMKQRIKVLFHIYIFIWNSTCFGRHTAHHQEPKIALAASGFAYVEGCWTCSCWTLPASNNYTSNNLPHMQNQRLLVQF